MRTFTFRMDFSDGFETFNFEAASWDEAAEQARQAHPDAESMTACGSRSHQAETFLAW